MRPFSFLRWTTFTVIAVITAFATPAYARAAEATPAPVAAPTPGNGLAWRSIGPTAGGGRVTSVTGTPLDPNLLYVGTAGGGVWKSTNGGIDWRPAFDTTTSASIGAVAISPANKETVWVGTGEAWPRNDVIAGNGIYVSTDGGQTWKRRGLELTSQIARIVIDPRNPRHLVVAALGNPFADSDERGVYVSSDAGETWRRTLFAGRSSGASDIAMDPANPDIMYAGLWHFRRSAWHLTSGGDADGLYKSVDGGNSWLPLTGHGLPGGDMGRIGLAVAPSNPRRVYALIESSTGVLWRSDDGGEQWALVSSNTLVNERPFYYSRLVVDPHDENHVFAASVRLAESQNGGKAWHQSARGIHGDHHDLWISADGTFVLDGNDGGPAVSRDGGHSWYANRTLATAQVYHLGFDRRQPYMVCAGLQDNGTWCGPSATGDEHGILQRDWIQTATGDGTWAWPDPLDPSFVWASSGGGDNGGALTRFSMSTLSGSDISPYLRDQNVVPPRDLRYRFNWESPLAFAPFERDTAYYGANVLFRSTDRGNSWQPISPDLTRNLRERQGVSGTPLRLDVTGAETFDTILDIAPSPLARGVIWVGTDDGNLQLTRDGGSTWVSVAFPGADADSRVVCVEASHASAGRAFIAIDRHFIGDTRPLILMTNDFGATWRSLSGTLDQSDFIHVVREDPRNPSVLYAGSEHGIVWSANRGESWSTFPAHLPPVSVHDIRVQPDSGDLIIGTHGRGIWIFDDLRPLEDRSAAELSGTLLFASRDAMPLQRDTPTTLLRGAGTAPEAAASISFYQRAAAAATPAVDISDRFGHVVRHLSGTRDVDGERVPIVPNVAGINRVGWDLTADPPARWLRAPKWNRGPEHGPPVLSGVYTITLHRDGADLRSTMRVNANRRSVASDTDEAHAHAFITALYAQLNSVDEALNVLDNLRLQLPERVTSLETSAGNAALVPRLRVLAMQAGALESALTSLPQNDQDDDFLQDMLRERLVTLMGSASTGPPTSEQAHEARALTTEITDVLARYHTFMDTEIGPASRELDRAGAALRLDEKPGPDPKAGPDVDEHAVRKPD